MIPELLALPLALPLAAAILIFILPRRVPWAREILTLLAAAAAFAAAWRIFLNPPAPLSMPLISLSGFSLALELAATPLASFILLFATGYGVLLALYSISYFRARPNEKEYYAFFSIALAGTAGVLLAEHMVLFLISWELVTASLYFLITTGGPEARAGATKTFAMLGAGDGCLLLGLGLLWRMSGSFSLSSAAAVPLRGFLPTAAFLLLLLAAAAKAGSIPLHSWIPAASDAAPASALALLPAAIDKLLGIYLLVRLATGIFSLNQAMSVLLMSIGAVTILAAVLLAMVQHNLRRLLAYHAVSQVGYMILGIGTLTPLGLAGALFHMLNNSIYKNCLFLCAGAVEKKAGTLELSELGGLARSMPATFTACLIASLAISGVPPLNGFVSKWFVYQGVIQTGSRFAFIFLIAAMFGSALTLASFVKVLYSLFLGAPTARTVGIKGEVSAVMLIPMLLLAFLCLAFGVYYPFPVAAFLVPALGTGFSQLGIYSSSTASALILIGLAVGVVIYLTSRMLKKVRIVPGFIGGELLDNRANRVMGTSFYNTIRELPLLRRMYGAQERGRLDPYVWFGGLGLRLTGLLRRAHNGLLAMYLSWSLAGAVVLIVLLVFLL
jgi:formate hydrogenlyase subunit 3/multisubunit Na+/H+ antiporter MnhD subunit